MNIAICGPYGVGEKFSGGQFLKIKILKEALEKTENNVYLVNSYNWKKHPFKLMKEILINFKKSDVIIMLPANKGVKIFTPILLYYNKRYKKKIFYDVIGGWLSDKTKSNLKLAKKLKLFNGIWVETKSMRDELEKQSFDNIQIVPNFKDLEPIDVSEITCDHQIPFKFCTFSRVCKEKGITDAINAINEINKDSVVATLDIFGKIQDNYNDEFYALINKYSEFIFYKGIIDSSKSVNTLKDYFMLLFPTKFYTEGIPGTLIDSFSAGLPVIASNWYSCCDIVNEKIGYVFEFGNYNALYKQMLYCLLNFEEVNSMKKNCLQEAEKYNSSNIMEKIISLISEDVKCQ